MASFLDKELYSRFEDLSEDKKRALRGVGEINAYLSASSIPEASQAARERQRQQEASSISRANNESDFNRAAMVQAAKNGGGGLRGTSMTAQMLNIWNDESIPMDDPRKQQAKAYLSRPTTTTTPEGVTTRPGILGGQETLTPRNPSGDEKRGDLAVAQIQSAEPSNYKPSFVEEAAQEFLPASVASLFTSDPYAMSLTEQRQLLSNTIYLQSGAAASPAEVEKRRLEFFPQNNDSPEVMQRKAQNLESFKSDALTAFKGRTQGQTERPGDKYLR
jgi:hypothetical protein